MKSGIASWGLALLGLAAYPLTGMAKPLTKSSMALTDPPILPTNLAPLTSEEAPSLSTLLGQVPPSRERFPQPTPEPEPLSPEEASPLPASPPSPEPVQPTDAAPIEIEVREIEVLGSTRFDAETLKEVVGPYENRTLTLVQLQEAADAITQLYLNSGYITSRAVLGDQTISQGVVRIQILEGGLEEIKVEGTTRLQNYVRSRLALGGARPLNQTSLENQLRLLRADPLFDNVSASLRAGEEIGQSILIVRVEEADPLDFRIVGDNYSPRSVGNERAGVKLNYRNLAGLGDEIFASAYDSNRSGSQIYELGYRVPLNPMNGTLQMRASYNAFKIVDESNPSFDFDIRGNTEIYEVSFRQPFVRSPREEFALSLGFRYRDGETLISDLISSSNRTSVFQFGQDYVRRDLSGAWALRSQFSLGTELFDATNLSDSADGQFFSWLGQVQRVQVLGSDNILIVQGDLQLSADSLLGSEQFVIGGGQSVRGYDQNIRSGDNGFRFSVEDRIALLRDEGGSPIVQVAPFMDLGVVWNKDSSTETTDNNFLLGTGLGVLFNPISPLDIRLDFAVPLETLDDSPDGLNVYFSINWKL
ncbi:MAG: ShlB/FhaC/HecB family hemolysin secretion/activation protein [Leptolyngbyaceae cyanobacterium MO_188.B28]|nr:ShlB/FhaC/HecB family hemolysin secretion/activation protein [Leptolyngbyaceae cyanobacterium MO_188.B28]